MITLINTITIMYKLSNTEYRSLSDLIFFFFTWLLKYTSKSINNHICNQQSTKFNKKKPQTCLRAVG